MEERKTTIDTRLEQKIGFDRIRQIISDREIYANASS